MILHSCIPCWGSLQCARIIHCHFQLCVDIVTKRLLCRANYFSCSSRKADCNLRKLTYSKFFIHAFINLFLLWAFVLKGQAAETPICLSQAFERCRRHGDRHEVEPHCALHGGRVSGRWQHRCPTSHRNSESVRDASFLGRSNVWWVMKASLSHTVVLMSKS